MRVSLSLLVLDVINEQVCVLIQKRRNPREPSWQDTWEVPQGKIADGESILTIARNELRAETGLELRALMLAEKSDGLFYLSGAATAIEPFLVVYLTDPFAHLSVHVLSIARGTTHDTTEAVGHRWVPVSELGHLLISDAVCPMNRGALEKLTASPESWLRHFIDRSSPNGRRAEIGSPVLACDVGGVLIRWDDTYLFTSLAEMFGCTAADMSDAIAGKLRHELHLGRITHQGLWEELCRSFKGHPDYLQFSASWRAHVQPIIENLQILRRLKDQNSSLRVVAATNIDPVTEEVLLNGYGWTDVFDHWFSSWRLRVSKPGIGFYQAVTDACQVAPDHILMIDDRAINLDAAREFGWAVMNHFPNSIFDERTAAEEVRVWLAKALE